MELRSDGFDQSDRVLDYIATLKDGYEQLEAEPAVAFDRIAALEDAVSALTGRRLGVEDDVDV